MESLRRAPCWKTATTSGPLAAAAAFFAGRKDSAVFEKFLAKENVPKAVWRGAMLAWARQLATRSANPVDSLSSVIAVAARDEALLRGVFEWLRVAMIREGHLDDAAEVRHLLAAAQ